jgi:hypothetical protein
MESSKKRSGKITEFGKRIIKVLEDNDLIKSDGEVNYSEAERLCKITPSILSKAVIRKGIHKENARKFQEHFHVNPKWFKYGKGEPYVKNGTPVEIYTENDRDRDYEDKQDDRVRALKDTIEAQKKTIASLERELDAYRSRGKN